MSFYIRKNKILGHKVKSRSYPIDKRIIPVHISSSIKNKLLGKDPSTSLSVYSYQNPYTNGIGQFVRNSNCWLNGVNNISCFSPAQLSGAYWYQRAGTLITKKHIILAKHFAFTALEGGTPLIFVDDNNNVIRRNLMSYAYDYTDIAIGVLDNDVPNNIKVAKVLPSNYTDYIETNSLNKYSLGLNQGEQAFVNVTTLGYGGYVVSDGSGGTVNVPNIFVYALSSTDPYYAFTKTPITGDSGNPVFIIIDNDLVILTCWWAPWSGPFVTTRYDRINELINTLSPGQGYSLSPIDLDYVYNKYV